MPEDDRRLLVERENPMPNFSFEVFYGAHGSAIDLRNVRGSFENADIFVPEILGWTPAHLLYFNAVSQGRITPQDAVNVFASGTAHYVMAADAVLEEFEMIYKSGKPIIFADVPVGHPLENRFLQLMTSGFKIDRNFDQTLQNVKGHLQAFATLDVERENYTLSHLQRTVEQAAKATPALRRNVRKNRKVKALLFLGGSHTRVLHQLRDTGFDVRATYSYHPFPYAFSQETVRRYVYGKEVSDEQAAKSYVDLMVLQPWLQTITRDFSKIAQYIRRALSGFTLEEIRMLFEESKQGNSEAFAHLLIEKGVVIPQTEQELNVFLQQSK